MESSMAAQQKTEQFIHEHSKRKLGMYFFVGAESVMFASLFATYFIMVGHTLNGPSPKQFLDFKMILAPTVLLLTSSVSCSLALSALNANEAKKAMVYLAITLLLAGGFLGFEVHEFVSNTIEGNGLTKSPYLSSFYLLVGMHGSHVLFGMLWMAFLLFHVKKKKSSRINRGRLESFSIYWHFVDSVWIAIFLLVYSLGQFLN